MASRTKQNPTQRRAVGYVRVSQVGGREGDSFMSPDVQREKIQAWATYRDFTITRWYSDLDVSGRTGVRRPEFERMMQDARGHKFEAVAVYRLTRFARSVQDAAARYAELRELGVGLVSVTEDIDTTSASGQFMQNVMFAMAEFESQRIGEEWRNVLANRRRRGLAQVTKHITGYRLPLDPDTGKYRALLELEPTEAEAVRLMFEMRDRGSTYSEIKAALRAQGLRPRLGGEQYGDAVIGQILRNPTYAGYVKLTDGELVQGQHEAIVSVELWERVQAKAKQVVRNNSFRGALLSGLLVCSGCEYKLQYAVGGKQRGNGYMRPNYYRCPSRQRSHNCEHKVTVQADIVEEYIEQLFLSRFNPDTMKAVIGRRSVKPRNDGQLKRLRSQRDKLSEALAKVDREHFVESKLDSSRYYELSTEYTGERAEVEQRIAELEATAAEMAGSTAEIATVRKLWELTSTAGRRRALRLGIEQVLVSPSPRRGKSQAALLPQRLHVDWRW